jgi:solute carrier family 25 (adenine nucleotide translocator) protein 4/5/6/31
VRFATSANDSTASIANTASSAAKDALAGALSGAFARSATAPIERVKLILQLQGSLSRVTSSSDMLPKKSVLEVTRQIYKTEGVLAFWKGNLQNVIRAAGQAALNFALMEYYKTIALAAISRITTEQTTSTSNSAHPKTRSSSWTVSFLAGGLAGGTVTTVLYPTEFLRTRLALDMCLKTQKRRDAWDVTKQILKSDGIRGIYRGFNISLVGSVMYRLLYLGGYDVIKNEFHYLKLQQSIEQQSEYFSMTWMERFFLAQFVALFAGTICYPIDSVRRRMMMQAGKPIEEQLYHSSFQCIARIWSQEGWRGFYLGFAPNVFRSVGGALALVAYDGFKSLMET